MIEQKIINLTWLAAMNFNIYQLRRVVVVDLIHMEGRADRKCFGWCDIASGEIQIRQTSHHEIPRRLSDATIIDTIAHELAHFIEFRHGKDHNKLKNAIKVFLTIKWNNSLSPPIPIDQG
jgi:hypothetical protein